MKEEELNYNKEEIITQLEKEEVYEKNDIKVKICVGDENKNLLLTRYKDIYIGCISKENFEREEYGLNKYPIPENHNNIPFYLGHWKNNKKEGIGFLKINDDILYFGEFKNNQIEGRGVLYYKNLKVLFNGYLKNGEFDYGILFNEEKKIIYRGKFLNMKKNDENGIINDLNDHKFYLVKYINNIPEKVFTVFYEENADSEGNLELNLNKFFIFDKNNKDKNFKINSEYEPNFQDNVLINVTPLVAQDYNILVNFDEIKKLILNLENKIEKKDYKEREGRYNPGKTKEQIQGKCEYFFNQLNEHFEYDNNEKEKENIIKLIFNN